jgi:hypothetical protein
MDASCFSVFFRPLPPKKAAPPCDTWRMIGELMSRAASRTALTTDEEVTFYSNLSTGTEKWG